MNDERQRDEVMDRRLDWALGEVAGGTQAPDVSKQVAARLAAGEVVAEDQVLAAPRGQRWLAAAAALLAVSAVVATLLWSRQPRPIGPTPATAPQAPAAPDAAIPWVVVKGHDQLAALPKDARFVEAINLDDADVALLALLPELEGLHLRAGGFTGNRPPLRLLTPAVLPRLASLRRLRILRIDWQEDLSGARLDFLRDLPRLQELALVRFDTDDAALAVLERMPSLRTLDLELNQGFRGDGLQSVARNPGIRSLSLRSCSQLSAAMLAPLAAMPQLEVLDLGGIGATFRGFFADGPTAAQRDAHEAFLRRAEQDGAGLTDAALAGLGNLPRLRRLDLSKGKFTDAGLQALARLPALAELVLADNPGLTPAALAQVPATVRHLDLSACSWVDAAAVGQLPTTLHGLALARNQAVDDQALARLAARCPQLQELDVRGCPQVTAQGLGALPRALRLRADVTSTLFPWEVRCRADIRDAAEGKDEPRHVRLLSAAADVILSLPLLADCKSLAVTPDLPPRREDGSLPPPTPAEQAALLHDSALHAISLLPKLEELRLTRQLLLTDAGFRRLRAAPELTWLGLRAQPVTDAILAELAGLPSLNGLLLTECSGFTRQGLASLGDGKVMHALSLNGCTQVRAEDLEVLRQWPKLDSLHLSAIRDGSASAEEQAKEAFLAEGWLDDRMLAVVQQLPQLRQLGLWASSFGSTALAATLDRLPELTSLNLHACSAFDASVVEHLPPGLRSLNLSRLPGLDDAALVAISKRCTKLSSVIVADCPKVTEAGLQALRAMPGAPSVLTPTMPR